MAKPKKNTFDDVKMLIMTLSITMTLVFWHLFSASAAGAETQVAVANIPQTGVSLEPVAAAEQTTSAPAVTGKIFLGGEAPQPQVIVQRAKPVNNNNNNNVNNKNNGGGGGGGGTVTQTKSS